MVVLKALFGRNGNRKGVLGEARTVIIRCFVLGQDKKREGVRLLWV